MRGELSPQAQSFESPCSVGWISIPKKKILVAFRQVLPKNLPVARSYAIMTYFKKLVGVKSLNTKQWPAGLTLRTILLVSLYLQIIPTPLMMFCCPHQDWTAPIPLYRQKIPLNKVTSSLSKVSFPYPSNRKFQVITKYRLNL